MLVKGRAEIRFSRRWADYLEVLRDGTPDAVGTSEPAPPDLSEAVVTALQSVPGEKGFQAADKVLDQVWASDVPGWSRRLSRFLRGLPATAQNAFSDLVKAGCQPDRLAFQFHEAAKAKEYAGDHDRLRRDLDALEKLAGEARQALQALAHRRRLLDKYLLARSLRVVEGEPGSTELTMILEDFEDLLIRLDFDDQLLRHQLDGRRQVLLGHAEVRLSLRVRETTGAYHDSRVERVLEELREKMGLSARSPGALKRHRGRWMKKLGGPGALKNNEG